MEEDAYDWFFEDLSNKCISSLARLFGVFLKQWHDDEGVMERFLEYSLTFLSKKDYHVESLVQNEDLVRMEEPTSFSFEQHILSDPMEEAYVGPIIEDIIEIHLMFPW